MNILFVFNFLKIFCRTPCINLFPRLFFQNGQITRERILVLFFFCSDVAILAIRQRLTSLVAQLTQWSLEFIRNQVRKKYCKQTAERMPAVWKFKNFSATRILREINLGKF